MDQAPDRPSIYHAVTQFHNNVAVPLVAGMYPNRRRTRHMPCVNIAADSGTRKKLFRQQHQHRHSPGDHGRMQRIAQVSLGGKNGRTAMYRCCAAMESAACFRTLLLY